MINKTPLTYPCDNQLVSLLQAGDISGFNTIYKNLYPIIIRHVLRRVKNDLFASIITQDAFLLVWLLRQKIDDPQKLSTFLKKQIQQGCADFYSRAIKFYHGLIKLDDIANYQEFMCGYNPDEEKSQFDLSDFEPINTQKLQQWKQVINVFPCLSEKQQLFIKLCLKHSFNYDEIANHLGGVSSYHVTVQVEKTLMDMKKIILNAKKLDQQRACKTIWFEGELTEEQSTIMTLRYEMNLCFEDIARKLNLPQAYVQKAFVAARTKTKEIKPSTKHIL